MTVNNADWLPIVQTFGIITGFLLTTMTVRESNKGRKSANYLSLLSNHRTLWSQTIGHPELVTPLSPETRFSLPDLSDDQLTFLRMLLLHLSAVYEVAKAGEIMTIENLRADVRDVLRAKPMCELWVESRQYHNRRFVHFVDNCLYDVSERRSYRERLNAAWVELTCS